MNINMRRELTKILKISQNQIKLIKSLIQDQAIRQKLAMRILKMKVQHQNKTEVKLITIHLNL